VTYRNATTGYDHLYYAIEEQSVSNLVGGAAWPVTRHWFDGLRRETNTVSESSDGQLSNGSRITSYPNGSPDFSVGTDAYGNATVTTVTRSQTQEISVEQKYAAGASTPYYATTNTQWRNGPSVTCRSWDGKFTQETRSASFDSSGNRTETVTLQASDITCTVTNSVTTFDFLGRTASVTTPLGVTAYTYATDRNRLVYTVRTGVPATERTDYTYDDAGEQVGTTVSYGTGLPESSSFSVTSYENISNETWRVTRTSRLTDSVTNSFSTTMEQLTGLGSGIIARSISMDGNSGVTTVTETSLDPATFIKTTTTTTDSRTPDVQTSKYGYTLTSSGLDGSDSFTYDSLGREAGRVSRDAQDNLLSTVAISYDGFGNVTTNAVTYGQATTPDVVTVNSFDGFGRAVSVSTLTQGQAVSVVTNGYDSVGVLIAQGGDTYPVTFGFDTAGRRTQLTTRYGATDASATTQWRFNAVTGLLTNKLDAAGKGAAYTYTSDGRPLVTAWARGSWKENAYNSRGLISSSSYSDSSLDVSYTYNAAGLPELASNATGFATAYAYSGALVLTNETISGLDASDSVFEIGRTFDARQRPSLTALSHNGTNVTQVIYGYDAENRLSSIGHLDASIEYAYNGNYMSACTITISNGPAFTRTVVRDPYRKHLINAVSNCFDGVSVHSTAYSHDLLSRRTNIIYSAQTGTNILSCSYNARSEVTGVIIDTNDYAYIYDNIGNNLHTSLNNVTNAYTVNPLNQYRAVTNLLDLSGIELAHDDDGNTTLLGEHELAFDDANRLSLYLFGWEPGATGTTQNVYFYDQLGRRVKKMVQELQVDDPGGRLPPTYWWRTNETTTFVYDGWNLIHERVAYTNGTADEIEYVWGPDLSGSLQGAGGVGGLLFEKRNGVIFIPCYDANGNITAYIDTNGTVRASYLYDAFGKTIDQSGDMADLFRFRFSTKYLDHDTGFYYYGYRYFSPVLQRWINRDPIEERGGLNLYGFVENDAINNSDLLGHSVYWNNYPNYVSHSATQVWEKVGGRLLWLHITDKPDPKTGELSWYNSCALRVSISLNNSGKTLLSGHKNTDFKATSEVTFNNKTIKKGDLLKAEKPNAMYVLSANKIGPVLTEILGKKPLKWTSLEEAIKLRECIEKKNKEAFFVAKGHTGMIKKDYTDPHFPYKDKGEIWITE
jgi:RHS repeat-associated protein